MEQHTVYNKFRSSKTVQSIEMATNTPWNSTKKTESWKKMSIIYIIFFLYFSRLTLINIYIDLRLAWHWFSSGKWKKMAFNFTLEKDMRRFLFRFYLKILPVRMLFIFSSVTLLCFGILSLFSFFSLSKNWRWHIYHLQVSAEHWFFFFVGRKLNKNLK